MKRPLFLLFAVSSLCLLNAQSVGAGTRPRYGGTARVQAKETLTSLDLLVTKPSTTLRQQLAILAFDRLTQVDENGAPQPALAESWTADPQHRIWQFHLRRGVSFHDGSPLSTAIVVSLISSASADWKVTSINGATVMIETESPSPHLPEILALPQYSIYVRTADGALLGTGPFKLGEFQPNKRLLLNANDDYWGGRPYLDSIDILMGNSVREQLIDRRLDRDDIVELGLDQARSLGWPNANNQRLAVSAPSDLYAIVFRRNANSPSPSSTSKAVPIEDVRVREALGLAIDRAAISTVLLQKQGDAAKALLPQRLTGYEFLFSSAVDLERARKLRAEAARNAAIVIPLAYDSGDGIARAIAERVAVNAREANITVQPFGEKNLTLDSLTTTSAQAVLVRLPLACESPNATLSDLATLSNAAKQQDAAIRSAATPEEMYAAERELIQEFRVVPIAHVPQIYWLNSRLKNWSQPKEGGWSFKDAWLESDRPTASAAQR
jgi:peptide/nickel transport system substrate-binding protein